MLNPILKGYTKKYQPLTIAQDKLQSAIILVVCIVLTGVIFLCSSCGVTPCPAEEIDLKIIAQIESNNNPLAYNKRTGASGMYQLMPCVVEEYNARHTAPKIAFKAVFSPIVAQTIANWYLSIRIPQMLKHYGLKDTIENRLRAYNSGIGMLAKGRYPTETRNYVKKYKKLARL